ncbi:DUF5819 family protein [Streptomyces sp. NPDC051987]|uniref:DUF5819 family protein n=1 Tax=Streptomyces sp. NPDC051987 TaxID=3155808 RepID=UPI0034408F55
MDDAYDEGADARHGPDSPGGTRAEPESAPPFPPGPPSPPTGPPPPPSPPSPPVTASPPVPSAPLVLPAQSAESPAVPRTGVAALSLRYQAGAALALALVAVAACVHLGMVFLSVAPANTLTKQHGKAIEEWVYPEFEQNWKLFAPNPLQQNIAVQVRADVLMPDGSTTTTGWNDLSAQDGRAIDGSLLPSHTVQNELRRAWDFFTTTHGTDNRPIGLRGSLSEQYLRRIAVLRMYAGDPTSRKGTIERVQVRSSTTNVPPPDWSGEKASDTPVYRVLPWWTVPADEANGGVR